MQKKLEVGAGFSGAVITRLGTEKICSEYKHYLNDKQVLRNPRVRSIIKIYSL